mgnify:CR=1 FL=1
MREILSSTSNPKIKRLVALQQKASERRASSLFVVEGRRELSRCLEAGYEPDTIFICPEIAGQPPLPGCRICEVSREVYAKIACRESTEGIIAEIKAVSHGLDSLKLSALPLIAVLESVEKPGNIGAVLRTCDAAGVDALIVCDPKADMYNPNLIRASLGAAFTVQSVTCSSSEAIAFLKARKIQILTAQLQDSSAYYDCDMRGPTAIVMGTESTGLSTQWREAADAHIMIPMLGKVDSLNVSVSAAILLYESIRQRQNG